jgi:sulfur carrier protein
MLSIKLNGKKEYIEDNSSIYSTVLAFKIGQNGIAVALNQQIVTKSDWSNTAIKNNDEILIIKATQGG